MVAKYLNLYYIVYWYCYIVKANGKNVKAIISYYVIRSRNFEANFLSIEKLIRNAAQMYQCMQKGSQISRLNTTRGILNQKKSLIEKI